MQNLRRFVFVAQTPVKIRRFRQNSVISRELSSEICQHDFCRFAVVVSFVTFCQLQVISNRSARIVRCFRQFFQSDLFADVVVGGLIKILRRFEKLDILTLENRLIQNLFGFAGLLRFVKQFGVTERQKSRIFARTFFRFVCRVNRSRVFFFP